MTNKSKFLATLIIVFLSCFPTRKAIASYTPIDGRITYLVGLLTNTNFQETIFNNNNNQAKLGRSQSFGLLLQALGDLTPKSSLMAEVTFGRHKFCKETNLYLDEYVFEAISFDLGYRKKISNAFWMSGAIGSLYPWKITQKISSQPTNFDDSEFRALYSIILGIQYESEINNNPVSYDFRIRKYMSSQIDDQMSIGFSIGWRFGT